MYFIQNDPIKNVLQYFDTYTWYVFWLDIVLDLYKWALQYRVELLHCLQIIKDISYSFLQWILYIFVLSYKVSHYYFEWKLAEKCMS